MEGALRTFYAFAKRKGYLGKAETAIESVESNPKPASDPKVLTPDQLMQVFQHVTARNRKLVPFIALGAFGGIRAAEIERLNWEEHIDLEERRIQLPSSVTKTNRRRVVPISDTLAAWLESCPVRSGPVYDLSNTSRSRKAALKGSGVQWPHNGLRHGFVSYEMARTGDASKTAETCGHGVAMLQTNYKQLVKRTEAERWFSITPELVKSGWPDKSANDATQQDITPESPVLACAS